MREAIRPAVEGLTNVSIVEPLAYGEFARLLNRAHIVLTDSGGIQEEAPSLGKPVLVMRDSTERPEAIEAGTVKLVGADETKIVNSVMELLHDKRAYEKMANAVNPYGDGWAAERSVQAIAHLFGMAPASAGVLRAIGKKAIGSRRRLRQVADAAHRQLSYRLVGETNV